jgi:tetratricopeptide (TPR) repeat protein
MRPRPSRPAALARTADFTSPLTIPGGEVAGAEVVRELPADVALTVWQALRCVLMWAAEIPAQRGDLFERRAMEQWECELLEGTFDADLRHPLAVMVGELADPEAASPEQLARTCLCVVEWSLARRAVRTALGFAEAAALCWPEHPRYAWMAGRLLRTHGYRREAEQWIKRSVRVAGSTGDWETQTLALNSLGNLLYEAGSYHEANRTQLQALRTSRKHGFREREGEVLHDLFVVAWYLGDAERAEGYARGAFEIYKAGHFRLAALAHDVAFSWVERGHYSRALTILRELPDYFIDPGEKIRVLASAARAAGGCGNVLDFDRTAEQIFRLAQEMDSKRGVAVALVELALGATSLEEWDAAERALTRAIEIASLQREPDVLVRAESTLSSVRAQRAADLNRNKLDLRPLPRLDALANGFVSSLQAGVSAAPS